MNNIGVTGSRKLYLSTVLQLQLGLVMAYTGRILTNSGLTVREIIQDVHSSKE